MNLIKKEKTIIISDLHGKDIWKQIVNDNSDASRFIFMGDYFDSFTHTAEQQINNFLDIVEYKKSGEKDVVMLIGNHDYHYTPYALTSGQSCSGFQAGASMRIKEILEDNKYHLQMAYSFSDYLFTHAGVSETWLLRSKFPLADFMGVYYVDDVVDFINDIWKHMPRLFQFTGIEPHGNNITQGPLWIRPLSLMRDSKEIKSCDIVQVVGHTQVRKIDVNGRSTGGKYYFTDTLDTSGEYLVIDGNVVSKKKCIN